MKGNAYSISEMAAMFGLTRQTLIYYDRIGLFAPAHVNEEGYRLYEPTQIPFLRLICLMRDLGLELKEIKEVLRRPDPDSLVSCLANQVERLDGEIDRLRAKRDGAHERLCFYEEVLYWKERLGVPHLRHYPDRYVVFEQFDDGAIDRRVLHTTLMRLLARMRDEGGASPFRGWGPCCVTMSLKAMTPLRGRGPSPFFPLALIHRRLTVFVCCQKGFIYAAAGGVCPMIRKAPGSLLGTPRAMGFACWTTYATFASWIPSVITRSIAWISAACRPPWRCRALKVMSHPC